jgi:hypothetical protein
MSAHTKVLNIFFSPSKKYPYRDTIPLKHKLGHWEWAMWAYMDKM